MRAPQKVSEGPGLSPGPSLGMEQVLDRRRLRGQHAGGTEETRCRDRSPVEGTEELIARIRPSGFQEGCVPRGQGGSEQGRNLPLGAAHRRSSRVYPACPVRYLDDVSISESHLSAEAQAVILALLTQDFPAVDELRAQVPSAIVAGRCGCGCATVDLRAGTGPR